MEDRYFQRIRTMADRNRKPTPIEEAMQITTEMCNPHAIDLVDLQKAWIERRKRRKRNND